MRPVLASVISLALAWPSGIAAAGQDPIPAQSLQAKAQQVLDHSVALAELWPGYWPLTQGFVLYDPSHGAVMVGADGRPGTIRYQPGALPGAATTFVFDYPAGSPNMMMMTVGVDWPRAAETLFHEQFHDFQSDAFDRSDSRHGGEYVDLTQIPDRSAFTAAAELERRVLADALAAESEPARLELARRYIALRREREAGVGETIAAKERYRERSEGTAQFIGLSAVSVIFDDAPSVREALIEGLRKDLIAAEGTYSGNWFRGRAYDVGGAIAWLLDRSVGDWKARVQSGEALDLVLEDVLGPLDSAQRASLAQSTRVDYGADDLLSDVSLALAALPRGLETPKDFLALGDRRLVLEIQVPFDRINEGRQFSQAKGMTSLGPSTMAFPDAQVFLVERPGILIHLENMAIMTEAPPVRRPQPVRRIYSIILDDGMDLGPLSDLSPGEHQLDSIQIREPGLVVEIGVPARVIVADGTVTVIAAIAGSTRSDGDP